MCYRTDTNYVCSNCGIVLSSSTGAVTNCNGRPPFASRTNSSEGNGCYGVQVDESDVPNGLCHNCTLLEEVERRDNDNDDDDYDDIKFERVA